VEASAAGVLFHRLFSLLRHQKASGVAHCLVSTFGRPSARLNLAEMLEGGLLCANMSRDHCALAIRDGRAKFEMHGIGRFDEKSRHVA
jgi:hypothetical protein